MQATYGGFPITGPTAPEGFSKPLGMRGKAAVDLAELVGAAYAVPRPMGNRSTEIRINCRRMYSTYLETMAAAVVLAAQLVPQAELYVFETSGASSVGISYPDACLVDWNPVPEGVGYTIELTFITGQPPTVQENIVPNTGGEGEPAALATWGSWDSANWQDLATYVWSASQVTN